MGLTKLAIKLAAPLPKPENYNRYLFIGPHPDDIEIGAGATAARLAAEGKQVCFLICTDGRYGDGVLRQQYPDLSQEDLSAKTAAIREEECRKSAAYLGIHDVRFLRLSDGGFYDYQDMVKGIARVVSDFQPEIIFAPDPLSKSESHVDHLNTGKAARHVACMAPYEGIMQQYGTEQHGSQQYRTQKNRTEQPGSLQYGTEQHEAEQHATDCKAAPVQAIAYYMTARPNRIVATTGYLQKQLHALKDYHLSQYPKGGHEFDSIELYLKLRSLEYGLKSGHRCAEAFRVLGQTHMHCLPEAGEY